MGDVVAQDTAKTEVVQEVDKSGHVNNLRLVVLFCFGTVTWCLRPPQYCPRVWTDQGLYGSDWASTDLCFASLISSIQHRARDSSKAGEQATFHSIVSKRTLMTDICPRYPTAMEAPLRHRESRWWSIQYKRERASERRRGESLRSS
jgi:hypothetical protein